MGKGRNSSVVSLRMPDELVNDIKALARNREKTVSELLAPAIKRFVKSRYHRGIDRAEVVAADAPGARLFTEVDLRRLESESVASPAPVPVINPAGSVATAAHGARLSSEVVLELPSERGISLSPEALDVMASPSKAKQPEIKGHHPCSCGSGKRYRDCCRSKLL